MRPHTQWDVRRPMIRRFAVGVARLARRDTMLLIGFWLLAFVACESEPQPEQGQWSLVYYKLGVNGLGSPQEPLVAGPYTVDEFPQPLAACIKEGAALAANPSTAENRRLFGWNAMPSGGGRWDMVLCVRGSRQYVSRIIVRYPNLGWVGHVDRRFVDNPFVK